MNPIDPEFNKFYGPIGFYDFRGGGFLFGYFQFLFGWRINPPLRCGLWLDGLIEIDEFLILHRGYDGEEFGDRGVSDQMWHSAEDFG
jgi:hypothetical protein